MSDPFLSQSWYRVARLKPRLRAHAQIHRHRYRGQAWYVLYDPASGRSHRVSPSAYLFIGHMDGQHTVDEIWNNVVAELDDDAPTQDEIIELLTNLHSNDMLQTNAAPDMAEMFERLKKQSSQTFKSNLKSPFSFRIPLWDPDSLLTGLVQFARPLAFWPGLLLLVALVIPALVLAGIHWPALTENVLDNVFATQNVLILTLTYPIVKLIHELGHGFVAKAHGGEVHELGVMFLVFFPVPYVDASSSTAFRSKWSRAGVAAAGILVEVLLAALAMYVWHVVEPGIVRAIAFNVMMICGFSTIVFNANPLLRFDGYYVFIDLLEIPNLAGRANRYWAFLVDRYAYGARTIKPPVATAGERAWFVFYAPASFVYRTIVMIGLLFYVVSQFFFVGVLMAIWSVISTFVWPLCKRIGHVARDPRLRKHRFRAVMVTTGSVAAILSLVLFVPAPLHTTTEGVVWLPESAQVRAATDGFVEQLLAEPGQAVRVGDALVRVSEPTLAAQIAVGRAKVEELEAKYASERYTKPAEAEVTRLELEKDRASLARDLERAGRLVTRSAADGAFLVPTASDLPGRYVREGEIIGYVTPSTTSLLRVVVAQDDIDLVRTRLRSVEVKLSERVAETFRAKLLREVPQAQDELPSRALSVAGGGSFASDPRDPKGLKSVNRLFQFDVALETEPDRIGFGARAHVRFLHDWEPLGAQLYRRIRQLLLSRLNA